MDVQVFDGADLAGQLADASPEALHAADFGVIGLDHSGRVTFYNRYEQALAGLAEGDVLGRDFFVDVAPCTNNFMVRERFMQAWEQDDELDEILPYTFSYRMKATRVRLRMIVRGKQGWLLVHAHV